MVCSHHSKTMKCSSFLSPVLSDDLSTVCVYLLDKIAAPIGRICFNGFCSMLDTAREKEKTQVLPKGLATYSIWIRIQRKTWNVEENEQNTEPIMNDILAIKQMLDVMRVAVMMIRRNWIVLAEKKHVVYSCRMCLYAQNIIYGSGNSHKNDHLMCT